DACYYLAGSHLSTSGRPPSGGQQLPTPGSPQEDGHDARRDLGRSLGPRHGEWVLRARTPRGRDGLGNAAWTIRSIGRVARCDYTDVRGGAHDVRRSLVRRARLPEPAE